jgi:hypothetical protein
MVPRWIRAPEPSFPRVPLLVECEHSKLFLSDALHRRDDAIRKPDRSSLGETIEGGHG